MADMQGAKSHSATASETARTVGQIQASGADFGAADTNALGYALLSSLPADQPGVTSGGDKLSRELRRQCSPRVLPVVPSGGWKSCFEASGLEITEIKVAFDARDLAPPNES